MAAQYIVWSRFGYGACLDVPGVCRDQTIAGIFIILKHGGNKMNEKSLLTLKQIADQVGVNYKTVYHYREVFEEFVKIQFQGRRVKYLSAYSGVVL